MTTNKAGYDPIPDVEAAADGGGEPPALSGKEKYPGFSDSQVELMSSFDDAIASSSQLNFQLPAVNPNELASKGEGFLRGLVAPTVTAVSTTIAALLLTAANNASTASAGAAAVISSFLIQVFPYVNAVIIFASSFAPIRVRFQSAVEPVFERVDQMQDLALQSARDVAVTVDATLDSMERKVRETIDPVRPTLDLATNREADLHRIRPDLDVPDPTDIDREFAEARGIVGHKIDEAVQYIDVDKYLPKPLKSADDFYWRIVLPICCAALLVQLGLAFVTTYQGAAGGGVIIAPGFNVNNAKAVSQYQNLVTGDAVDALSLDGIQVDSNNNIGGQRGLDVLTLSNARRPAHEFASNAEELKVMSSSKTFGDADFTDVNHQVAELDDPQITVKPTDHTNAFGDRVPGLKVPHFTGLQSQNVSEVEAQLRGRVQQYEDDLDEYETEFNVAVGNARSMLKSVAISYLVTFLQLALVYLITNEAVKAWIVNKALEKASDDVGRTLREYGVSGALEDVFGTRMGKIRTKVLKILTIAKDLKVILDTIDLVTGNPAASLVSDALENVSASPAASLTSGANALAGRLGFGKKKAM